MTSAMDEEIQQHIDQVNQWLDENVQSYPTPKQVTLHSFQVNWDQLSGSFKLCLDENELSDVLTFRVDQSGKTDFYLPKFHSPLGAPASYPAIELTQSTSKAILSGLHKTVPRVMGLGINRQTGEEITYQSPIEERILNKNEFEIAKARISFPDYSITVETID